MLPGEYGKEGYLAHGKQGAERKEGVRDKIPPKNCLQLL
jgi:hypothetical protein